ncbi:hypothetical protein [Alistipes shahii]|uniref:hypothetical protein n=1 Tax=Alistipes shahii TaxID=328814 RepID=UPI002FE0AAC9
MLANPRQAPVLAQPNVVPAKATCGWFCAAFAIKSGKQSRQRRGTLATFATKSFNQIQLFNKQYIVK